MRLADMTLAFPALLLLIAVVAAFGPSLLTLFLALGVLGWAPVARVLRSQVLSLRRLDYIDAARALGCRRRRILLVHVLPACSSTLWVLFSMGMAGAIIAEGSLSFLGLGAQPPQPSWGTLIRDGFGYLRTRSLVDPDPGPVHGPGGARLQPAGRRPARSAGSGGRRATGPRDRGGEAMSAQRRGPGAPGTSAAGRRRWEALAQAEGLDPRRHPWCWDAQGRLLLRPGRALVAAQRLAAAEPGALELLALRGGATGRIAASRSSLRRHPAHAAEQISQLRLGDPFLVWHWNEERTWCLGAGEDGYPGWLRAWHLVLGEGPPPQRVVRTRSSRALSAPAPGADTLLDLSFGTRLAPSGRARAGYLPWRLPDGRPAWTPVADLAPWPDRRGETAARAALLERGLALCGLPYEWGGASSAGLDCSGLVQVLLGQSGSPRAPRCGLAGCLGPPAAAGRPRRLATRGSALLRRAPDRPCGDPGAKREAAACER